MYGLCCAVCHGQALSWTLYELLQHPAVEQQLLQELHEVLGPLPAGSSGSRQAVHPSYDQIRQLRFTRACFLEALRLHPSIPEVRVGLAGIR
jgi:cytochrome P450